MNNNILDNIVVKTFRNLYNIILKYTALSYIYTKQEQLHGGSHARRDKSDRDIQRNA